MLNEETVKIIITVFFRVLKQESLYHIFFDEYYKLKKRDTIQIQSFDDFVRYIIKYSTYHESHFIRDSYRKNDYDKIILIINSMLYLFIQKRLEEKNMGIDAVINLGRVIFENSCKQLYDKK